MTSRTLVHICIVLSLLLLLFAGSSLQSQTLQFDEEKASSQGDLKYYLQLKNEEFLQAMIPKERFLLGLVSGVNEEMNARRYEGAELSELGILEALPPDRVFLEEYEQEIQRVVRLMDEVTRLEKIAKQQVDFQVLDALARLRIRIRAIIEEEKPLVEGSNPSQESEMAQDQNTDSGDSPAEIDPYQEDEVIDEAVRLSDLYEKWKYNRILKYKVKFTEYEFYRTRLLRTATPEQELRMFRGDLERALINYSAGDFPLSRLQLRDILDTFSHYQTLDDVLYYCGESSYGCNFFDEAIEVYSRLVGEYPDSEFGAKALIRLVFIYYIYGEFDKLAGIYQQLAIKKDHLDPESFDTATYLVGFAQFRAGNYESALDFLTHIDPGTPYFFPALYLSAACYSNVGKDDLALSIYHRLVEEKEKGSIDPILNQIINNALLKLGLIYYERGQNQQASEYFESVSQDFPFYDLSVMGKAWSAYRSGKPGEALQNVEWILRNSLVSNYVYEARVLAASSKDLLGHSEEAIEDLKHVMRTGDRASELGLYRRDQKGVLQKLRNIENDQQKQQEEKYREIFDQIKQIQQFLDKSASWSDGDNTVSQESGVDFATMMEILTEKIALLDEFEALITEGADASIVDEIRHLRSDLIDTLEDHRVGTSVTSSDSEKDPILKRMGMTDYLKYVFRLLLTQTLREKQQTLKDIEETDALLGEAREQDEFNLILRMEIAKEEFEDYYGRLNQHEVWIRENFPMEFRVDLDKWATFSGYGISNINFSRIKDYERQIAHISQTIDDLDYVFKAKKKDLENRIQGLLSDVAKIEDQMLKEAVKREQTEKDRFFQLDYFNRQKQESVGKLSERPEPKKKEKE
jgi:TolA-binding protein